jgi:hypothetical protein
LERRFWHKLFTGDVNVVASIKAFVTNLALAQTGERDDPVAETVSFQDRMAESLRSFRGSVLLILSGRDLTAKEFIEYARSSPPWAGLLERADMIRHDLRDADHTFSSAPWARQVEAVTLQWLQQCFT